MKMNQPGFSAAKGLLIILTVWLVLIVGLYVRRAINSANTSYNNVMNVEKVSAKSEEEQVRLPFGWIEYKDNALGFSFAYPKEWGHASITDAGDKRRNIEFTGMNGHVSNFEIYLHSNDAGQIDAVSPAINIVDYSSSNGFLILHMADSTSVNIGVADVLINDKNGAIYTQEGIVSDQKYIIGLKKVVLKEHQLVIFKYVPAVNEGNIAKPLYTLMKLEDNFKVL